VRVEHVDRLVPPVLWSGRLQCSAGPLQVGCVQDDPVIGEISGPDREPYRFAGQLSAEGAGGDAGTVNDHGTALL